MDKEMDIIREYVVEHLDKTDRIPAFEVYCVWQCHILGNRKWLFSTTLPDGMYYELTWDNAKKRYYLDAYKKFENRVIEGDGASSDSEEKKCAVVENLRKAFHAYKEAFGGRAFVEMEGDDFDSGVYLNDSDTKISVGDDGCITISNYEEK